MWKFFQSDKNGYPADFEDGRQVVIASTYPPLKPQKSKVFSQKFTVGGAPAGTSEMGVDGSVTPVEYCILADDDDDLYITRITFILGYGGSAEGYEFADSGAVLTNGVKVSYTNSVGEEVTIMNPKANFSFMRSSGEPISLTGWEARGFAASGDYGYFVNISLIDIMPPVGIKLDRGTTQRMCITIRDACTDADLFNCQAFGFKRFE